jgi:hypothetical protein
MITVSSAAGTGAGAGGTGAGAGGTLSSPKTHKHNIRSAYSNAFKIEEGQEISTTKKREVPQRT